ncbi:hypothetical protein [Bacillus velezensis]|uniref:hypothetical protein n=1 Tax=Bacillus velezensis TaxID=492670 RepID=UPI001F423541|nr:hypothetical protein [Bacillus velezensis]
MENLKRDFENRLIELELNGVNFPSDSIGDSWKADVGHFLNNFNKIDSKMVLEKLLVFEISDGIYLQGYVDAILPVKKENRTLVFMTGRHQVSLPERN